ncbi:MAG: 23S rRNA (adenine(2503)-C(2))-methyltransferase RlmN [Sedimentisphaerales bacterium]|jgi:23S rRNA (adenine2503-C2)-methyltransferase|nr:23S rRNA (adenine(2503)-C(2))-methyltransferase RlmN [Sedimentisphaerales bacterium]
MQKDLKEFTHAQLEELVKGLGGRSYWAGYIFSFIHTKAASDIDAITPLPKSFRQALKDQGLFIGMLKTEQCLKDPDGTIKLTFTTQDGLYLESVVLRDRDRNTVCISCQSGCRMGCLFCATGAMGFQGNLTAGQIVDQVYQVNARQIKVHNVVYMGMGEPFDNYDAVLRSARLLNDKNGLNIGQRRITISTCGIPEGIVRMASEGTQFRLAISLHGPDDQTRGLLMPVANRYGLAEVLRAAEHYQAKTGRRITIEYCMLDSINDSPAHARALVKVLKGLKVNVNLIEFNPFPGARFAPSPRTQIRHFCQILRDSGLETAIRFRRGQTISAACGQLGADRLQASKIATL